MLRVYSVPLARGAAAGGRIIAVKASTEGVFALAVTGERENQLSALLLEMRAGALERVGQAWRVPAGVWPTLFVLQDGHVCVRLGDSLHLWTGRRSTWRGRRFNTVRVPPNARCVWGSAPDELYAATDELHWFDGRSWRRIRVEDASSRVESVGGWADGDGAEGLNVAVGMAGTISCIARGRRTTWEWVGGCSALYLNAVRVFGVRHAVAGGGWHFGTGVWRFDGNRFESVWSDAPQSRLGFAADERGHTVLGGFVAGGSPRLWIRRGERTSGYTTLRGLDSAQIWDLADIETGAVRAPPYMSFKSDQVLPPDHVWAEWDPLPRHLTAEWLCGKRLAIVGCGRCYISDPIEDWAACLDRVERPACLPDMVPVFASEYLPSPWPSEPGTWQETPSFFIDLTPVTNLAYAAFLDESGRDPPAHWPDGDVPPGREHHPVVGISVNDAAAFAAHHGRRLPTEEEWERAARVTEALGDGGIGDYFYERFWTKPPEDRTSNVGLGVIGPFAKDLGMVWEWTATEFSSGMGHVVRGGPWRDRQERPLITNRSPSYDAALDIGFRCACDNDEKAGIEMTGRGLLCSLQQPSRS